VIKSQESIKWVGTILFFVAALLLSSNFEYSRYGFVVFAIAHVLLSLLFFKLKDKPMFIQNFVFLFVDLYGIYNYFIAG
jgi:hypothetical protein